VKRRWIGDWWGREARGSLYPKPFSPLILGLMETQSLDGGV